jgi:hypothetical protein
VRQIRWFPYIAPSVVERLQATISMPLNDRGISDYFFIRILLKLHIYYMVTLYGKTLDNHDILSKGQGLGYGV